MEGGLGDMWQGRGKWHTAVKGNHLFEVLEVGAWQEGFVLQASGNQGRLLSRRVTCGWPCFTQRSPSVA